MFEPYFLHQRFFFMVGQRRFEELLSGIFIYCSCTFDLSACHHSCAPINLKVKFSPQRVGRHSVIALLILDLGCRKACVVNATPRPLYPWESPINLVSLLTFRRRIKSHLPFAGIIRRLTYSTRFQDEG